MSRDDPQKQIHDLIISKLESIESTGLETKELGKKTNGRVTNLELELVVTKKDIAEALKIISGHSTIISYYKQESDKAKDNLIENLEKKVERDDLAKEVFNKRVIYTLVLLVLFTLASVGLINKDLIKFIL